MSFRSPGKGLFANRTPFCRAEGSEKALTFFSRLLILVIIFLTLSLLPTASRAQQLCQGSLGDPIVNIHFGQGSSPRGGPLEPGITNYTYTGSLLTWYPDDGQYTIANSTYNMNPGWHVASDHTPGASNGYMMVVNASRDPGDFYRVHVRGLCPGTRYEAAAWVMNLLRGNGIEPNITFVIESPGGSPIETYSTGNIPSNSVPTWVQYGFFFDTQPGVTEVVFRIRNNAPGGGGNDLALDDITFRPCGPDIQVAPSGASSPADIQYCEGDNVSLSLGATVSDPPPAFLSQWQRLNGDNWEDIPGETGLTLGVEMRDARPGTYQYRLALGEPLVFGSVNCRVNSNVFNIVVNPKPVLDVQSNGPLCYGNELVLTAGSGATYNWTGPNGFSSTDPSPRISNTDALAAGTYTVTVTSSSGCVQTGQTTVVAGPSPVPDAGADISICVGASVALHATGGTSYRWLPARGLSDTDSPDPIASPTQTTTYTVYISNGFCELADEVTVRVIKPALADAGTDKRIVQGNSVRLDGKVDGPPEVTYYWTPSTYLDDPTSLNPVASPPTDIVYTLHTFSNNGCSSSTDEVVVEVFENPVIPSSFSPNGDGINDVWEIKDLASYDQSELRVYNRYGMLVFSQKGYNKPWDGRHEGKDLPVGVYYYVLDLSPRPETYKGWVSIIR